MTTPKMVTYEGQRCRVLSEEIVDGKLMYELRVGVGRHARRENAWAADCATPEPSARKPHTRKLRDGDVVLEFDARGVVFLRRRASRRRYPTSLRALYDATVKAAVAAERFMKKQLRKKGK